MIAPISLVVPSYGPVGNPYAAHVDKWWAAVARMDPQPAEVIVPHSDPEPLGVIAKALPGIRVVPVSVVGGQRIEHYINPAVSAASQPWVSCIGIDDEYRPRALADLQEAHDAGAEILLWHHDDFQCIRRHYWDPVSLRTNNTVHGSCPFRKTLWERVGGQPLVGWVDWAFWLRCAHAEARVFRSDQVGVLWDPGHTRNTWTTQATSDGRILAARNQEIANLVRELWG
jgi:hypothetical protein